MGRRKIEIQPIAEDRNRTVTFIKRKAGLFKKAHELSVLCKAEVALVILGHNNTFYEYSSVKIGDLMKYYNEDDSLRHVIKHPSDFGDFEQRDHVTLNKNVRRRNYNTQANAARLAASVNEVIKTGDSSVTEDRPLKRQRTEDNTLSRPTLTIQPPTGGTLSSATSPMDLQMNRSATVHSTTPPLLHRSAVPSARTTPTASHSMEALPSLSMATHPQTMVSHGMMSQIPAGIPVQFIPSTMAHLQMGAIPQQSLNTISTQMYQQQAQAQQAQPSYMAPQRYLSPVGAVQRPHMSEPNLAAQDWYSHMQQQQQQQQGVPKGAQVYMTTAPGGMYPNEMVRVAYGPPLPTPVPSADNASLTPERRYTATSSGTSAYEKVILPSVRRASNVSATHSAPVARNQGADTSSGSLIPSAVSDIGVKHESPKSPGGLVGN